MGDRGVEGGCFEALDRAGEPRRRRGVEQDAGPPVDDRLERPAGPESDDRAAGRHRLDRNDAEVLGPRRDERTAAADQLEQAGPFDVADEPGPRPGKPLEGRPFGTVADDDEVASSPAKARTARSTRLYPSSRVATR